MSTIRSNVAQLWFFAFGWLVLVVSLRAQPAAIDQTSDVRPLQVSHANSSQLPNSPLLRASAEDAGLNSIAIISADRLCAVGDCGMILITEDGGRNWVPQSSGTTCNLHAVAFQGEVGFAVGGWIGQFTGLSYGAILKSTDGGRTWSPLACEQLSRLKGLEILKDRLIVWGDYSPQLKTSVMESVDGGISWRGVAAGVGHASAVGFSGSGELGAIDMLGNALFSQQSIVRQVAHPNAPIHALIHDNRRWIGCGAKGELISSLDGVNWVNRELPLSSEARSLFDCRTMTYSEGHIWVCGSPGSILFHSSDGGENWRKQLTGQSLPIADICFIDKNRGWLVGAQGLILATRDGGNSWYPQRQYAQRASVLSIVQDSKEIPWLPLVATVWDEKRSATSIVAEAYEPLDHANFVPSQAMQLASHAPQVGLAQHQTWSIEDESFEQVTRRLAVAFLTWRPDVVLTDEKSLRQIDPSESQRFSVGEAIELASSSLQSLPVADELGLDLWSTSKLVVMSTGTSGQYSEQLSRVLGDLGISLWDVLMPLPPQFREQSQTVSMRTVWARSQANVLHASLLGGIARDPAVARELRLGKIGNYQLVMGRIHRNRSLEQIVEQPELESTEEQWRAHLMFLLDTLPAPEIAPALVHQSRHALELGNFRRQRVILETLAARAPLADATNWARFEILRLASSDEFAAWRSRLDVKQATGTELASAESESAVVIKQAAWNASPFDSQVASAVSTLSQEDSAVVTASTQVTNDGRQLADGPHSPTHTQNMSWFPLLDQTAQRSPTLLSRTDLNMLVAQNMLKVVNETGHIQMLETVASQSWMIGWRQAAQQELLLANQRLNELKSLSFVVRTNSPPILDGELNEPCWKTAPAMELSHLEIGTADPGSQSKITWAYDDRYLYIAIECRRVDRDARELVASRNYDAEISHLDHIQLTLDTDRDYSSVIELGIAENGQTYDRCCGYSSYNPKWHVMVKPDVDQWRAEVAIELAELTTASSLEGGAWAVSARRVRAGQPIASWSSLKTHQPFAFASGLLLFAPDRIE